MANIGSNLNLNRNQLQNAALHPLASAPSSPVEGQVYFDTSVGDKKLYVWDGSTWVDLTVQGGGVTFAAPSQTINAGDSASEGSAGTVLRSDAQFAVATAAASTLNSGSTNTEGSSTSLARADHTHAITGLHTQNTDAGTTASLFYLVGTTANDVAIKKESNGLLALRTGADGAYVDLKAKDLTLTGNLTVQGTTTTVNSETMTVDDNIIVLNNNITTAAGSTENAGVAIKRYAAGDVLQQAELLWDETNDRWSTIFPASSGTGTVTRALARKFTQTIGDTSATTFNIDHNFNTSDVTVAVRKVSTGDHWLVDSTVSSVDRVVVSFATAPATNEFVVTVVG